MCVLKSLRRPTDAELRILNLLWEHGALTVRQVHTLLAAEKRVGYTTALKMLQVMTQKGLVKREEGSWPHRFTASFGREATQRRLVDELVDRAFGGSANALVLHAVSRVRLTAIERDEIRRALSESDEDEST